MQRTLEVLGVQILDTTMDDAVGLLGLTIELGRADGRARSVFFANAHTLNCASEDQAYRDTLNQADLVFGDGTGVRWAARIKGAALQANLNGTDMTPEMFRAYSGRGFRYYLLGATPEVIDRAAARCRREVAAGWVHAGHHHGYVTREDDEAVVARVNRARPDVLLVGMGNPLQEQWIHRNRDRLQVPLVLAVGGLFHYWAEDMERAPAWMREVGMEWVHILLSQPHKAGRYLLGNPVFLARAFADRIGHGSAV